MSETRQAKLPDGELVTWHMFFVDSYGDPMALVEMRGGNIRNIHATWVEFCPTKDAQDVAKRPLTGRNGKPTNVLADGTLDPARL